MKRMIGSLLIASSVASGVVAASAADRGPSEGAQAQAPANPQKASPSQPGPALSNGIAEILQLIEAGVSNELLEAFIESSPVAYQLSAGDVIALKQKGVSDSITVALLKHGSKLRATAPVQTPGQAASVQKPLVRYRPAPMGLDPDSYEYFQYYYLHPRTLASVYQRLGIYGAPYPYGPYRPLRTAYPGLSFAP